MILIKLCGDKYLCHVMFDMEANTYDPYKMIWRQIQRISWVMETNTYESTKMNMEMNANDYANNAKGEYPLAFIIDIEVNPQVLKSRARIFKSCYEE